MRRMFTRFRQDYIQPRHFRRASQFRRQEEDNSRPPGHRLGGLSWISTLFPMRPLILHGQFLSNKRRTLENVAAGDIVLTDADKAEIANVLSTHEVKGDRYFGNDDAAGLWG